MMKINLLPRTINERKIVRNTAILFGVLVIAVAAIGIAYTQMFLVPQVQAEQDLATRTETLQHEVEGIEAEAKSWQDKIVPVKSKLDFITSVLAYNLKYPKLYEDVAKWTYEKISYTGLTCDGTQMSMSARARSLDDLGRFLLNMYQATDLFTEVTISGVPGYPIGSTQQGGGGSMDRTGVMAGIPGGGPAANLAGMGAISVGVQNGPAARYIDFTVNCKLKTPIAAPAFGAAGGAAAGQPGAAGAPAPAAPPAAPAVAPPPGGG